MEFANSLAKKTRELSQRRKAISGTIRTIVPRISPAAMTGNNMIANTNAK
jgi:hypothetical protein